VGELSGPGTRDAHLGEEVLLDNLGSDATGTMFHVHISKGAKRLPIHPLCGDGTFPAIQLTLLGKGLPL
jgi:hypothetical protein